MAGLFVYAALAAGCSSPATVGAVAAGGAGSPTAGGSPQQQATQAEHALLGAFASIPGADVLDKATFGSEEASESWHLHAASAATFAAAVARLPRWPRVGAGTDTGFGQGRYGETVQTSGSGTLARQTVNITILPEGTDASTLQVSVGVYFRPVKPAAERIADSSILTVKLLPVPGAAAPEPGGKVGTAGSGEKVITSASTIAQVAADINALPTMPLYVAYCPSTRGSAGLSLDFAPSASAPESVSTVVEVPSLPAGLCAPGVRMTINGIAEPELDNSVHADLFAQLEQLTGVS